MPGCVSFYVFVQIEEAQMRFLNRAVSLLSRNASDVRGTASAGRCRARIEIETLENRDLLSVAGVTLQFGNLAITGQKASGNVAKVWVDSATHDVAVSLNGQSEEFTPSQVTSITYKSGTGGGDSFINSTGVTSLDYGYGGHNSFTGGTGFNYVYDFGNNNTFTAEGGVSDVWTDYGSGDSIVKVAGASVTVYAS
jgi:hypothetical protein